MPRYPVDNRIKVPGQIPFGEADPNAKYGRHSGDDSANSIGTPVYAPSNGVVTSYVVSVYHGNVVEIFDGSLYPHVFHLSRVSVKPGTKVIEGQLIGYTGNTGLSTGPHIHFGVSKKSVPNTTSFGDFIDPMQYIKQGGQDMITKNDTNRVRIVNSEIAGYDFLKTHKGDFDAAEMKAWVGQPWTKFIDEKWKQGEKYRASKAAQSAKIKKLEAQLAAEAKVLAPGKYLVN